MNIWASRFGQEGVNLAIDNSFRLQVVNASTSPFTLNLFNLGGSSATQTSITTGQVSIPTNSNQPIPFFVNGVVTDPLGMEVFLETISDGVSYVFPFGTTIAQINSFYQNNVTNSAGQIGSFVMIQKTNTTDQYNMICTIPVNGNNIVFADFNFPVLSVNFSFNTEQVSYATNNPLVTFRSNKNTNINLIQNSEVGNSYKITGMDVYSENSSQVLEPLNYFYRDANGNLQGALSPPIVSPYQPNQASLQMVYVDNFQITTNTQFQYIINALTSVYLTYNYVNFGVNDFREFGQIFYQQTRDVFMMDKKLVEMSRIQSLNVE